MAGTTKDKIIDATLSFYDKLVFQRVPLSKIAKRAGISKPAIYRHFKSRDELENAVFDTIVVDLVSYVKEHSGDKDPYEKHGLLTLDDPISAFCKKKRYFYYVISNTSTNFNLDEFFLFLKKKGVKSLGKVFADDGSVVDFGAYKKVVYISATFLFFQGARDKTLADKGEEDTDEKIQDYAQKLSHFILDGGLSHDLAGIDDERLFALNALCRRSAAAFPLDETKSDVFFHAVAQAVSQKGFAGVTVEDIAERIGLAKSTLYEKFTSKTDLIRNLIIEECVKLFSMMRENMMLAKSPAESVFILMASEFEFFLRDSDFMYVLRWLQMQNTDDEIAREDVFIEREEIRDFDTFLYNSDIITQKIDLGQPEIGNKALLAWVFYMPVFVMALAVTHGFSTENYHETLKGLFWFMERGINYEAGSPKEEQGTNMTTRDNYIEENIAERHNDKQKETVNA